MRRGFAILVVIAAFAVAAMTTGQPSAEASPSAPGSALKLPFGPEAEWVVTAADVYPDSTPHLTMSDAPMAFDLDVVGESNPHILSVGSGRVRIRCAATMAIVELDVAGHGIFTYLHLDAPSLSGFLSTEWTLVDQGVPLGRMFIPPADGYVEDWDCGPQYVAGAHLHLEMPQNPTVLDGVVFGVTSPRRGAILKSTNTVRAIPVTAELATPASVLSADDVVAAAATIERLIIDGYTADEFARRVLLGPGGLDELAQSLWPALALSLNG